MVISTQTVSPRLLDAALARVGFGVHYTGEPKPEDAPDNLFKPVVFKPIEGHNTSEGSFEDRARPKSLYAWLEMHPVVRRGAAAGLALGLLAALRVRS
jgi:hypothetical protein